MATPWDRAAKGYVEEWVPRFVPYHLDLVQELKLLPGQRVLVTCAGPGAEVLAVARAVGDHGHVVATDSSGEMIALCREKVQVAGFKNVECRQADALNAEGGPWDAVVCAFGLWQLPDRISVLSAWRKQLATNGKIGIITWGPPEEDDPFERVARCLAHLEPGYSAPSPRILSERDSMAQMFDEAELSMVRHTVVRHTLTFRSAEAFVTALREACTWRKIWEELGDERLGRVAARFYGLVGGPDAPLSWDPPATMAIAGHPGADVQIESRRASVRVPAASGSKPDLG
jgi:ubiquinone/menaquinone biosynthesis C-methylase UbiE